VVVIVAVVAAAVVVLEVEEGRVEGGREEGMRELFFFRWWIWGGLFRERDKRRERGEERSTLNGRKRRGRCI